MLRWIIVIVLLMHGIGHVMGMFPVFGLFSKQLSADSWLLTGIIGQTATRWLGFLLWLVATLGFVGAALGILNWGIPYAWWRTLAIIASVASLAGLLLFWNAFFTPVNKLGAMAVDVAVLVALLWAHWPTEETLVST